MDKQPWSRTQKISLWSIIVFAILAILGWFIKIERNISYIQDKIENIKVTGTADIKSLIVEEFLKKCPPNTSTTTIEFTDKGMFFGCISSK